MKARGGRAQSPERAIAKKVTIHVRSLEPVLWKAGVSGLISFEVPDKLAMVISVLSVY